MRGKERRKFSADVSRSDGPPEAGEPAAGTGTTSTRDSAGPSHRLGWRSPIVATLSALLLFGAALSAVPLTEKGSAAVAQVAPKAASQARHLLHGPIDGAAKIVRKGGQRREC